MKLTEQQLREILRITKKRHDGSVLYGYCPKCKRNEFGISLNEGNLFGCFRKKRCGFSGNIFELLKFLGISPSNYGKMSKPSVKIEKIDLKEIGEKFQMEVLPERRMPIGFRRIMDHPYLRERGFINSDFENYVVGTTNLVPVLKGYVIVGIPQFGRVVAYTSRSPLSKEECERFNKKRYINSKDDFSKILDGIDESNYDEATIVEGIFDRINVRNCFQELGIESRVCCSFGAKFSDDQMRLLLNAGVKRVNLFFDSDIISTFIKAGSMILHKFEEVKIICHDNPNEDPGDLDVKQIWELYKNKKNFINFTLKRLPIVEL